MIAATPDEIRDRDWRRCVRGGSFCSPGHVHHRQLGNRSNNRPGNLILLCDDCHRWCHANSRAARDAGWIVSRHVVDVGAAPVLYGQPGRTGSQLLSDDLCVNPYEI